MVESAEWLVEIETSFEILGIDSHRPCCGQPTAPRRRHKTLDSIWVDAVASDRKWVRSARKGFEAPLRGFVASAPVRSWELTAPSR